MSQGAVSFTSLADLVVRFLVYAAFCIFLRVFMIWVLFLAGCWIVFLWGLLDLLEFSLVLIWV